MLQTEAKHVQKADESLRGFFPAEEADGLSAWSTDELFMEVLRRSTGDAPTLRRMQEIILKALLAAV